jgi:aryl-alcohol dehydrogenase-like predicted oxidoreductase
LANGLLVKPADQIVLSSYCSSKEEEARREIQLRELRSAPIEAGSLARRALAFPRSVDGVSVTLLGARSVEQLRGVLREA